MKRKKQRKPLPDGCSDCMGHPFVSITGGVARCWCKRGTYYRAMDRKRGIVAPLRRSVAPDSGQFAGDWA